MVAACSARAFDSCPAGNEPAITSASATVYIGLLLFPRFIIPNRRRQQRDAHRDEGHLIDGGAADVSRPGHQAARPGLLLVAAGLLPQLLLEALQVRRHRLAGPRGHAPAAGG